jgi:hypothetical protein
MAEGLIYLMFFKKVCIGSKAISTKGGVKVETLRIILMAVVIRIIVRDIVKEITRRL